MLPIRIFLLAAASALLTAMPAPATTQADAPATSNAPAQQVASQNLNAANVILGDSVQAAVTSIDRLHQTLVSLNVTKWKVPGSVRSTAQSDVDSMQRDVSNVLPDLMERAKASPRALGPAFAVFRNIDALYDVLLRVSETATLASAQADAGRLEEARAGLEESRSVIGNAILQASTDQDAELVQLRAAAARTAAAAPSAIPKKTVVDDAATAPAAKSKSARKRKSVPANTAPAPQQ